MNGGNLSNKSAADHRSFVNCLFALLDGLGWQGEHESVYEALPVNDGLNGVSLLRQTMSHLNFHSEAGWMRLKSISEKHLPCVVIYQNKPVVLLKRAKGGFLSFDGHENRYGNLPDAFSRVFTVNFRSPGNLETDLSKSQPYWFVKLAAKYRREIIFCLWLSFFLSLLQLMMPYFMRSAYDGIIGVESMAGMKYLWIGVGVYLIAGYGLRLIRQNSLIRVSVDMGRIVYSEVVRRILYLPLNMTESVPLASQMSRVRDFDSVRKFIGGGGLNSIMELPFILVLLFGLYLFAGYLVIVPLMALVCFLIFGFFVQGLVQRLNAGRASAQMQKHAYLLELSSGLSGVKVSRATAVWKERFAGIAVDSAAAGRGNARLNAMIMSFSQFMVSAAGIVTLILGVKSVIAGQLSSGGLMGAMILVWRILAPMRNGFSVLSQISRIQKSVKQLDRLMKVPVEYRSESAMRLNRSITGHVRVQQVSIRYGQTTEPALLGVSMEAKPGELVLITGHDGSGRTTLLKLLLGLYQAQSGKITLDGLNIKQLDPMFLRRSIAYVPADDFILSGTVEQNLLMVKPTATRDDMVQAFKKAGIDGDEAFMINLLETRLSRFENTTDSHIIDSIPLVRACLKNSRMYLFDEPDRKLTGNQKNRFMDLLRELKGESTVFLVSSNMEYLSVVDKVLFLERGRVSYWGSSEEFLNIRDTGR
jgi:ATP-binding cassette subfamily C protein/ATP-binding cassette subfamily C protein LapB